MSSMQVARGLSSAFSSVDIYTNFMDRSCQKAVSKLKIIANENIKYPNLRKILSIFKNCIYTLNYTILSMQYTIISMISFFYYWSFKEEKNPCVKELIKTLNALRDMFICKSPILVSSRNDVSFEDKIKYKETEIELDKLALELLGKLPKEFKDKELFRVTDMQEGGICRGMCEWFDLLYIHTKEKFKGKSEENHIKAIANIFRRGSPIEGHLMQLFSYCLPSQKYMLFSTYGQRFDDPFKDVAQTQKFLKQLPIGSYGLFIKGHACNLIKVSENCMYLWDPNFGLRKIQDDNLEKAFLDVFKLRLCKKGERNSFVLLKRDQNQIEYKPIFEEKVPGVVILRRSDERFDSCISGRDTPEQIGEKMTIGKKLDSFLEFLSMK